MITYDVRVDGMWVQGRVHVSSRPNYKCSIKKNLINFSMVMFLY